MRLRKKTWSPEIFETHAQYCVPVESAPKNQWKKVLDCETLHVEIGSGKGDYWHQLAELHPDRGFVALERDYTACAIALKKVEKYANRRKRLIYGDAKALSELFGTGEVDVIHLNFSDPWPKTRHEKRRLTYEDKLKDYDAVLSDTGRLVLKTDNRDLFNYSLVSVAQTYFVLEEVDVDFRSQQQEDPFTEYERKFHDLGQPIYRAVWRKRHVK